MARLRAKLPITAAGAFWYAVLDPGHFVMERKMLMEIKQRAEALAAVRATAGLASIGAASRGRASADAPSKERRGTCSVETS